MSSAVNDVIAYWVAHDVHFLPGVEPAELRAFEKQHAVTLPDDIRAFYEETNGTKVPLFGQDHQWYEFWPLSEIVPEEHYPWAMNFADYQMMSWWYAFDAKGDGGFGRGAVYLMGAVGGRPLVVARTFTEFLGLYIKDDPRIWPKGAAEYHKLAEEGL